MRHRVSVRYSDPLDETTRTDLREPAATDLGEWWRARGRGAAEESGAAEAVRGAVVRACDALKRAVQEAGEL